MASYVGIITNDDGSVIRMTGSRSYRSSRFQTRGMVDDWAYAVLKPWQSYEIRESKRRPEIYLDPADQAAYEEDLQAKRKR
jgi:hypothetical protein